MSTEPTETVAWGTPAPSPQEPWAPSAPQPAPRRFWQAPAVLAAFLLIAGAAAGTGVALSGGELVPATSAGAPTAGACSTYDMGILEAPTNEAPFVPCDEQHSAQTFRVVDVLPDPGPQGAWSDQQIQEAADAPCSTEHAAEALGIDTDELATTRLGIAFFTPTAAQAEAGARWIRCDVVLYAGGRPATVAGDFRELVDIDGAFARCESQGGLFVSAVVRCEGRADQRAAIGAVDLGPFGTPIDREDVQKQCREAVEDATDATNPSWTATAPSAEAWEAGVDFATCWLRADQWTDVDRDAWPVETPVVGTSGEDGNGGDTIAV